MSNSNISATRKKKDYAPAAYNKDSISKEQPQSILISAIAMKKQILYIHFSEKESMLNLNSIRHFMIRKK